MPTSGRKLFELGLANKYRKLAGTDLDGKADVRVLDGLTTKDTTKTRNCHPDAGSQLTLYYYCIDFTGQLKG